MADRSFRGLKHYVFCQGEITSRMSIWKTTRIISQLSRSF